MKRQRIQGSAQFAHQFVERKALSPCHPHQVKLQRGLWQLGREHHGRNGAQIGVLLHPLDHVVGIWFALLEIQKDRVGPHHF